MNQFSSLTPKRATPETLSRSGMFQFLRFVSSYKKQFILSFISMIALLSAHATAYTSVGGNWSSSASWSPVGVPGAADAVTIASGTTITVDVASASADITINGGTLKLNAGLTVNGAWTFNSGTFTPNTQTVSFATGSSINGPVAAIFYGLEINATGVVPLNISGITIANNGTLALTNGIFNVGTGNQINFGTNGGTFITAANGNFATTNSGADGGTINQVAGSGSSITVTGNGTVGSPTFYNLSGNSGNWHLNLNSAGVLINGTLPITSNQFQCNTNAPVWGANSSLTIDNSGQQYSPGSGNHQEWLAVAPGTGVIGTTAGYPNNVTIQNVGSSASNYNSNQYGVKLSGNWSINGTFQVGNTSAALVDLDNGGTGSNSFSSGGVIISAGSKLAAPGTFTVNGNWLDGGTFVNNSGTVNFGGGSCGTPGTLQNSSSGSETFYNLGIINSAYVKLNSFVNVTHTLALAAGIFDATTFNIFILNNSPLAITGGGAGSYVAGVLGWSLQAAAGNYVYPLGGGSGCSTEYLPFTLNKTAGATIVSIEAHNTGFVGGTTDGTLSSISTTEYWGITTSAGIPTNSTVSISRPTPLIAPMTLIAVSNPQSSSFTSAGGTVVADSVINSTNIGGPSTFWFTFGAPPIVSTFNATSITTSSVTLNGGFNTQGSSLVTGFNWGTTTGYGSTVVSLNSPITSTASTADSAHLTGLTANTLYHYQAEDAAPKTGNDIVFITAPNPPIVGVGTAATGTGFTANWTAPTVPGTAAYTYTIEVSMDPTFAGLAFIQSNIPSGTLSYTLTTLASGTTYYYRVRADNATASSDWSATSASITTTISQTIPACSTGSGAVGNGGSIVKTSVSPIIDGQVDSIWSSLPANNISNVSVSGTINNTQTWKSLWTTDSLYFLIQVTDATLISQGSGLGGVPVTGATQGSSGNYYDYDGVEITLDPDYSHGTTYDQVNDIQLRFNLGALTVSGQSSGTATQFTGAIFNRVKTHVDYVATPVPGGYNVEVAIPWGTSGANPGIDSSSSGGYNTPGNGSSIGLEVQVNDADHTGGRDAQYSWFNTSPNPYQDPQTFAQATLTTCTLPPTVILPTATAISATGATLGATVTSSGDAALTARGTGISASPDNSGAGNPLPEGGTAISIYSGPARTGLLPQTKYYFTGYATNANNETGVSTLDSFFTLSQIPAVQPTFSTSSTCAQTTLNWSAVTFPPAGQATLTGFLILRRQDGTNPTTAGITTRVATTQGALPAGTTLLGTAPGSATSFNDPSAVFGTPYNYLLVPYTWDGVTADSTYNYFTAGAPTTTGALASGIAAPTAVAGTQPTCSVPTGSITITQVVGLTYSIDGTNYFPASDPTFSSVAPGVTYHVTATNGTCPSPATDVVINGIPSGPSAPTAVVGTAPTCTTPTGSIAITQVGSDTYSIDGTNYFLANNAAFTGLALNTYNVTAENAAGCISATSTPVTLSAASLPAAPTAVVGTAPTCTTPTGSIAITQVGSDTYSIDGTNYFPANNAAFTGLAINTYNVTTENAGGCISATSTPVTLSAASLPSAPTAVVGTTPTCTTPTGSIAITQVGSDTYSIDGTNYFPANNAAFTGLAINTYNVTTENTGGCISSTSTPVTLTAATPPATPAATTVQPTCTVATGAITITQVGSLTYSIDGTNYFPANNAAFTGLAANTYTVTAENTTTGCTSITGALETINTQPVTPVITSVTSSADTTDGTVQITLTGNVTGADPNATYAWAVITPSGTVTSGSSTATATPTVTTTYGLTVTNPDNCFATGQKIVVVTSGTCFIPNAFTPNGDGFNDLWVVRNPCSPAVDVSVYNRWGSLVFHQDNYQDLWDGTYNGKPLPDGTYYYVVTVYKNNINFQQTGNVTIMR